MGFKEDIRIERHTLDEEWMKQPALFAEYSEKYAQAMFERDKAKEQADLIKAQIDSEVRADPVKWGIEGKVTEGGITGAVLQSEEYLDAKDAFLTASLECNIMLGAKAALEHKKSALDALVKLYLSGYWGEVKVPVEVQDAYEDSKQIEVLEKNPRLKVRGRRIKNGKNI